MTSDAALPRGWVPLGEYRWFTAAMTLSTIPAGGFVAWYLVWAVFKLGVDLDREMDLSLRILTGIGAIAVAAGLVVVVQRIRAPRPFANFDTSQVRFGSREVPMADLVWAQLIAAETKKTRSVSLLIGTESKTQAVFQLVDANGREIDPGTARLVGEVLRRSAVDMPRDRYDPTGRFAKVNFPTNVTREEAIEVVLSPPKFGEELPIPPAR